MVIFMFSMYSLAPITVLRTSFFAVAVFGITMATMAHLKPAVYEPAVEWGHFIMIAIMVPAIAVLAGQLSRLRDRLRRQKKDIATALARIQELATRDELTGLINRRHMLELMEQERQRGVRSGQSFCIAVIDIDDFHEINERHGHAFADQLLRRFANEALNVIRISDLLCRWDGKEFLLMLSNTRASLGRTSVERLRDRIKGLPVEVQGAATAHEFLGGRDRAPGRRDRSPDSAARRAGLAEREDGRPQPRRAHVTHATPPWRHLLLALAVVAVWGTNFVVIKMALAHLPPLLFAALRFALAILPRRCCSCPGPRCPCETSWRMAC
jgi:diguanylate cyclase (GGDEF)-like protein